MIGTYPKHPSQTAYCSCRICDNASLDSSQIGSQSWTSVEPEPSKPEEDSTENDITCILRFISQSFRTISATFAEKQWNSQSGGTRTDVYWGTACKVETSEDKWPTIWIPSPASDGIVNDGSPDEDKYEEGAETAAFGDGTYGESRAVLYSDLEGTLD